MSDKPECYPRKRFANHAAAEAAVSAIWRRERKAMTVKRCKHCDGYHLN